MSITHSKINGYAFGVVRPHSTGFVMSDSEVNCNRGETGPERRLGAEGSYGIFYGAGTYSRLDINSCENGIEPGAGTLFQDSWVHDLHASGPAHYDGVSIDGGQSNITIRHNFVDADNGLNGETSAIMVDNWAGSLTGIVLDRNLVKGGQYTIYADGNFSSANCRVTMTGNQVHRGVYGFALIRGACVVTQSGNVNAATGAPITL